MEQLERTTESSEYLDAFLRLRTAKGWLAWLVLVAIILNLGLCLTVRCTSLLDKSPMLQSDLATLRDPSPVAMSDQTSTDPRFLKLVDELRREFGVQSTQEDQPTPAEPEPAPEAEATPETEATDRTPESSPEFVKQPDAPSPEPLTNQAGLLTGIDDVKPVGTGGNIFYQLLHVLLPMARVGGLFCGTLLVLVLLMSLKVVLLGRLRGVAYLTSAVLWSLVLLVLLIPWDAAFAGFPVPGVLFGARELIEGSSLVTFGAQGAGWEDHLLYWMRFVGYPVLAMVLWLTIQVQYARSYRPMVAGLQAEQ